MDRVCETSNSAWCADKYVNTWSNIIFLCNANNGNWGFFTNESFTDELRLLIKDFEKCRSDFINQKNVLGHLNIVTYNNLLGVPCYIITRDGKAIYSYSSMYLSKSTSINFPHFNWEQGPMCEYLYHYVKGKYDLIKAEQQSCTLAKWKADFLAGSILKVL